MQLQSKIPEEVFRKIKYLHEAVMHRRVKPYGCQLLMKLRTSPKSQKLQKKKTLLAFHKDCLSRHNALHVHILVAFYGILITEAYLELRQTFKMEHLT